MAYKTHTIGDLCLLDRVMVSSDSPTANSLPFLGLEHIESLTGRIICEALCQNNQGNSAGYLFDTRHVLYCKLRPYLNKVATPDFRGRCTTELIPLIPKEGVSRDFLAWLLRRPQTVQAAMQERTGARMPRANMQHVLAQQVMVPDSLEEQQQIADEMTRRMALIVKAKLALNDQLLLLDAYAQKAMSEFPLYGPPEATKSDNRRTASQQGS